MNLADDSNSFRDVVPIACHVSRLRVIAVGSRRGLRVFSRRVCTEINTRAERDRGKLLYESERLSLKDDDTRRILKVRGRKVQVGEQMTV